MPVDSLQLSGTEMEGGRAINATSDGLVVAGLVSDSARVEAPDQPRSDNRGLKIPNPIEEAEGGKRQRQSAKA